MSTLPWTVTVKEPAPGLFQTEFEVGVQGFRLAESDDPEEGRAYCDLIAKCFKTAMQAVGAPPSSPDSSPNSSDWVPVGPPTSIEKPPEVSSEPAKPPGKPKKLPKTVFLALRKKVFYTKYILPGVPILEPDSSRARKITRAVAARHETAHAVVAAALGGYPHRILVGRLTTGLFDGYAHVSWPTKSQEMQAAPVFAAAGDIAVPKTLSAQDAGIIIDIAFEKLQCPLRLLKQARLDAARILGEHEKALDALTKLVEESHGPVDGPDVLACLRKAEPRGPWRKKATDRELKQWLLVKSVLDESLKYIDGKAR